MILFGYHWNDIVKKLSKVGRVPKKYLEEDDYIGGSIEEGTQTCTLRSNTKILRSSR